MPRLAALLADFQRVYGQPPARVVRAPGRVNLIGEHTDYNQGFVLPMAIDRDLLIAARARADRRVHLVALDLDGQVDEFALDAGEARSEQRWANYVRGVAYGLKACGLDPPGLDAAIRSDVPTAAGLSSSAALEVCAAATFEAFGAFRLDKVALAQLCQRAENEFVGVKSGIMDQFASALARAGQALLIDCRDLSYQYVPLPPGVVVVVADTMQKRQLAVSEYNRRREECEAAVAELSRLLERQLQSLRDVSPEDFRAVEPHLAPLLAQRARHVITENARVLEAVAAARGGDAATFGRLMNASHESLQRDYQVSSDELDLMVTLARAQPGCLGARLTGAGFGGSTVNLVREGEAEAFVSNLARAYRDRTRVEPTVRIVRPAAGVSIAYETNGAPG